MKRFLLSALLILFVGITSYSQPSCLNDIWQTLNNEQFIKAKRLMDACMDGNEGSAHAWLAKGNVYLQLYSYENDRKKSDATYVIRYPNALFDAYDAFYKSIELNPDVEPMSNMMGAKDGQLLCAYPLQEMGLNAMKAKDFPKAIELIEKAIKAYRVDAKANKLYIAYANYDLSNCYYYMKDDANRKKLLQEAAALSPVYANIYLDLYDIYKKENDTVNCGKIINTAMKIIPDSLAIDIKGYMLDFYSMTGDTLNLQKLAGEIFKQYGNDAKVLAPVSLQLVNNGLYDIAEPMILKGLELEPNNFDLLQTMGFRYYYDVEKHQNKIETIRTSTAPDKYQQISDIQKVIIPDLLQKAHQWLEKGYAVNKEDRSLNIMFRRVKVLLQIPVPDDLKAKVDSYYSQPK